MNGIASKIKEVRKIKGLSQEELAESSGVNLRTIQRIENEENEPRGKTLQLICKALTINIEDLLDYNKTEDKNFLIIFHLSVLAFWIIPLGNIILPLVLWLSRKDKVAGLKEIGANLLNFQIIWTVFTYVSLVIYMYTSITHYRNFGSLIYVIIILLTSNTVIPIVFAIRMNSGRKEKLYPGLIKFIKY